MIVYHGTTLKNAEEIRNTGLLPHLDKQFVFGRSDQSGIIKEDVPRVYVTKLHKTAEMYAAFRARYERAKFGEEIPFSPEVKMRKLAEDRDISAIPAIVSFSLPAFWELNEDEQSPEYQVSFNSYSAIPAKYVTGIERLKTEPIFAGEDFPGYVEYEEKRKRKTDFLNFLSRLEEIYRVPNYDRGH